MNQSIKSHFQKLFGLFLDYPVILKGKTTGYSLEKSQKANVRASNKVSLYPPYFLNDVEVGDYTIIQKNSQINNAIIGKFSSIGPGFICGMGIHPINGISTSSMFFSTKKQNGYSLTKDDKIIESRKTSIGHDVWTGVGVIILDGVTIGDGAIIGAGAVVTKDIPPYAIATGVPAKVIKYRFTDIQISKLLDIQWWNFEENELTDIEKHFFDIDTLIEKYSK